jgi:uncharacterized protein YoxC
VTHEDFEDLAPLYALGALDGEDLSRFAGHLSGCATCIKLVAEYEESATGLADALPRQTPPAALKERILSSLRETPRAEKPGSRARPWAALGLAAGALVALALGALLVRSNQEVKSLEQALRGVFKDEDYLRHEIQGLLQDLEVQKKALEADRAKLSEALDSLKAREKDLGASKEELAKLGRQLEQDQAELKRLARMDALIRDLRTQVFDLSGAEPAPGAQGRVFWKGTEIHFSAQALPPLPQNKLYELWLLVPGPPIPAGLYDEKGTLVKEFNKIPEGLKNADGFAVTQENAAGVTAPTSPLFLVPHKR